MDSFTFYELKDSKVNDVKGCKCEILVHSWDKWLAITGHSSLVDKNSSVIDDDIPSYYGH